MLTVIGILAIISAIVMAGYTYARSNQKKYKWVWFVTLLPIALLFASMTAYQVIGKGYIAGIFMILALLNIAIIPGAVLGWLVAGNNAKVTGKTLFPILLGIVTITATFLFKVGVALGVGFLESLGEAHVDQDEDENFHPYSASKAHPDDPYDFRDKWDVWGIDESEY